METIETKDLMTAEAIEEAADVMATGGNGLGTVAKVGLIGAASIACWEFVVKPVSQKVSDLIARRKVAAVKKNSRSDEDEGIGEDMDIPSIDE